MSIYDTAVFLPIDVDKEAVHMFVVTFTNEVHARYLLHDLQMTTIGHVKLQVTIDLLGQSSPV